MRFTHLIKQISVFLCLVFLSCTPTTAAPNGIPPTTCSVTILGTSGKLFCNFGVDLRETKHDFQVQRYDSDTDDTDPDRVLVCNWRYPASLSCKVNDAYAFSGQVSDEAVIEIPKVTKETEGLYRCHMIPPDAKMEFCVVSLSDRRPTESTSKRSTQLVTNMVQTVQSTTYQSEQDPSSMCQNLLVIIIPFAVAVVFAFMVGIVVGLLLSSRWKCKRTAESSLPCCQLSLVKRTKEQEIREEHKQPLQSST